MIRVFILVLAMLPGTRGWTEESDPVARARAHFEAGRALFSLGNYQDALREFTSGHDLVPKSRFLLNIAHCERKLGHLDQARDTYRRFLEDGTTDAADRRDAERYLQEVERALAASLPPAIESLPPRPPPPLEAPPPPAPRLEATAPPAPALAAPFVAVTGTPARAAPHRRALRHLAWIVPVAAVVVAGVVVGAYLGSRPAGLDCSSATIACLDATR